MALTTRFTRLLGVHHPIVLAPMGGSAGGALAAAVSQGGGLGLLGAADGDPGWLDREAAIVAAGTDRPWGVGLLTWMIDVDAVDLITDLPSAADLVPALAAQAEEALTRAGGQ
jgi:nitronate monooxygenase